MGWVKGTNGGIEPKMFEQDCAPIKLRDITHLICNDKTCRVAGKCPCLMAGLSCIDICNCTDCENSPSSNALDSDSDSDSE